MFAYMVRWFKKAQGIKYHKINDFMKGEKVVVVVVVVVTLTGSGCCRWLISWLGLWLQSICSIIIMYFYLKIYKMLTKLNVKKQTSWEVISFYSTINSDFQIEPNFPF